MAQNEKQQRLGIPELKENMRRTTNTVLEINKLLKEVRPLSEETPLCSKSDPLNDLDEDDPRYVFNTFFSINHCQGFGPKLFLGPKA